MEIPKPDEMLDRDAEWRSLEAAWKRRRPDLVFVLGRRRVGKSFVLSRFARAVGGIYYQATRRTEAEQLAHLSRTVGEHFGDEALRQGATLPSWEALFEYVTRRAAGEPFLLVLDEFPYLAGAAPALPSIVQSAWDHLWPGTRMKVVLSGSYVTAMRELEAADQPLYGRRTAKLAFSPFGFPEAARFTHRYAMRDRLRAYAIFGSLPGHLALIDSEESLSDNVMNALLEPTGRLVDDAQHMLDAFLGEADVHYSIIEAIATGEHTWSGITRRVGRSGGALLRPMRWLEEMGLIARVVPITEKTPQRSKRALYRITDPYLAFWHRVIAPLVNAGSIGLVEPLRLWAETVEPRLDDHMGPVWEDICRDFVRRTERLPFAPLRVGEWWDVDSRNQVDVVAMNAGGDLLVGECKWGGVNAGHLAALRTRGARLAADLGGIKHIHHALFSARGEADDEVRSEADAGRALLFTAEDAAAP